MLNKVYYKIPPLTFAQNFARSREKVLYVQRGNFTVT